MATDIQVFQTAAPHVCIGILRIDAPIMGRSVSVKHQDGRMVEFAVQRRPVRSGPSPRFIYTIWPLDELRKLSGWRDLP